ncbi:hypothetical protein LshimejAT787_1100550 [Lyophyllum shimeji]|uniref:Uncharacterized protein n=1 Tax=Lyophyllum shimeji TaxID=47721 RepID=A0A9P3US51_LYOSH|nr:hypothetical protein LshimejAT787_1100550 [Lyophyllum shimeji]
MLSKDTKLMAASNVWNFENWQAITARHFQEWRLVRPMARLNTNSRHHPSASSAVPYFPPSPGVTRVRRVERGFGEEANKSCPTLQSQNLPESSGLTSTSKLKNYHRWGALPSSFSFPFLPPSLLAIPSGPFHAYINQKQQDKPELTRKNSTEPQRHLRSARTGSDASCAAHDRKVAASYPPPRRPPTPSGRHTPTLS